MEIGRKGLIYKIFRCLAGQFNCAGICKPDQPVLQDHNTIIGPFHQVAILILAFTQGFFRLFSFLVLCLAAVSTPVHGIAPPVQQAPEEDDDQETPRSYADVITADAESDAGLFDVHRVDETVYFEIPDSLLGRDMLLVTRIAKVPVGFPGYSPAGVKTGEQVLRWERRGDRILLRTVSYSHVADDTLAISMSVEVTTSARSSQPSAWRSRGRTAAPS